MKFSEFAGRMGLSGLVQNTKQAWHKTEYDALITGAAMIVSLSPEGAQRRKVIEAFIEDCNDLEWMRSYPTTQVRSDIGTALEQLKRNPAIFERQCLECAEKVLNEGAAHRILAVLCNMASVDGNFDGEELRVVTSIGKALPIAGSGEEVISKFDASIMAHKKGSEIHGKPGWQ